MPPEPPRSPPTSGQARSLGSVVFVVLGDGKELARTPLLTLADGDRDIKADVSGIDRLELRTKPGPDGRSNDWAVWFSPILAR